MKYISFIIALAFLLVSSGCTNLPRLQTWIQPYERELLADPYMNFNHDPITQGFRQHVHQTREGANVGFSSNGGGCGCN